MVCTSWNIADSVNMADEYGGFKFGLLRCWLNRLNGLEHNRSLAEAASSFRNAWLMSWTIAMPMVHRETYHHLAIQPPVSFITL